MLRDLSAAGFLPDIQFLLFQVLILTVVDFILLYYYSVPNQTLGDIILFHLLVAGSTIVGCCPFLVCDIILQGLQVMRGVTNTTLLSGHMRYKIMPIAITKSGWYEQC